MPSLAASGLALQESLGGSLHLLSSASWVLRVPGWRRSSRDEFEAMWSTHPLERRELKIFGRRCFENRYSQAFGESYAYSGQIAPAAPIAGVTADHMAACNAALASLGRDHPLNSCLLNWYEPEHSIAAHRDDERDLIRDAPIASISWGHERRFLLKPHRSAPEDATSLELYLADGDLLIMGGETQTTHTHEVPKRRRKDQGEPGRRISWTFRSFRKTSGSGSATGSASKKRKRAN